MRLSTRSIFPSTSFGGYGVLFAKYGERVVDDSLYVSAEANLYGVGEYTGVGDAAYSAEVDEYGNGVGE